MIVDESLYREILKYIPIPCVDLLVTDPLGEILMVKRLNEPARDLWWFPGGRVYIQEARREAAIRKLREECSLTPLRMRELGTFDLFIDVPDATRSHGITTLFHAEVANRNVALDPQSGEARWASLKYWKNKCEHAFLNQSLSLYERTAKIEVREYRQL